jgi:signal transduction histidine kinase
VANLYLARRPDAAPFDEQDERYAALLATFVSVTVVTSNLYRQALMAKRAREDLLATVSHDLKNPLNAIKMSIALWRRTEGEGKSAHIVARIERATERMARLIDDLLHAAKIEAGVLQAARRPEDVASLVGAAVEIFRLAAEEKSIQLAVQAPSSPVSVACERSLVLRVFVNLVGNAIKFSPNGSSVSILAEERGSEVRFAVQDKGPGISAEHLLHVFDRYWQENGADRRGSGLGLYIAKGIVEAHGGRIWIESTVGAGTTIHFTLPLAVAAGG